MIGIDLRPLTLGEILDRTFTLYRRHFLLFICITAIPHLYNLALGVVNIFAVQTSPVGNRAGAPFPWATPISGSFISSP